MAIETQLQVAAARCLSLLQRYHDGKRTVEAKAKMAAEVEVVIGWLMELGSPSKTIIGEVLTPVENLLLAQYGHEVGGRLGREFIEVFEGAGMPLLFKHKYYQPFIDVQSQF